MSLPVGYFEMSKTICCIGGRKGLGHDIADATNVTNGLGHHMGTGMFDGWHAPALLFLSMP
jgi:hypothetical protein